MQYTSFLGLGKPELTDSADIRVAVGGNMDKLDLATEDNFNLYRSGKDSEDIYTILEWKRKSDNTLARKSVLSGGTSPEYTTRTVTYYAANGTTVVNTIIYTLTYSDGELISEVSS